MTTRIETRRTSLFTAFAAAFFTPIALLVGIALAHIPFILWPQYDETSTNLPLWLLVIEVTLGYALFAPTVFIRTQASLNAIKEGKLLAWLPMIWFSYLIVWQLIMLVKGG